MRELAPDVLAAARVLCVDQISAALSEAGELIEAVQAGVIDSADLIELGHAIEDPPEPDDGITIFKSVGVAIQDWAIARLVADRLALPEVA
jgi:ornithine cyclodeaminase